MTSKHDFSIIESLELDQIKAKLMHKSGEGWSAARANAVEREYRRFLILAKKYPDEQMSLSVDVDTFWHYHILHTKKYAADCEQAFGYFLHHFPYVGERGAEDAAALQRMGDRMRAMCEETFGDDDGAAARQHTGLGRAPADAPASPAYCGVTAARTAYCGVAAAETAYCGIQAANTQAMPAYCGVQAEPAYCGVATKAEPAYCGVATKAEPAYCGVATKAEPAYCGVATKAQIAYCGVAVKAEPAYCGVAIQGSPASSAGAPRRPAPPAELPSLH